MHSCIHLRSFSQLVHDPLAKHHSVCLIWHAKRQTRGKANALSCTSCWCSTAMGRGMFYSESAHGAGAGEAQRGGSGVGDGHQGLEAAGGVVGEGGRAGAPAQLEHAVRPLHVTAPAQL
jgi:hypothetical protein